MCVCVCAFRVSSALWTNSGSGLQVIGTGECRISKEGGDHLLLNGFCCSASLLTAGEYGYLNFTGMF